MSAGLEERIAATLATPVDPAVAEFAAHLAEGSGADAVLFYGSNLRTGLLEGVLDFYLLLPGRQVERVWPRVSYHEWVRDGVTLRAKAATMAQETFARAARGETLDTTIWARFVQPSALVWRRSSGAEIAARDAIGAAAQTAARLAAALGPKQGTPEDFWRALFRATYRAEFRVELPGREDSILAVNTAHFDGLLPLALAAQGIAVRNGNGILTPQLGDAERRAILGWWRKRQRLGKPLNLLRLAKASTTFDGAARYAAWKIERHTGVALDVTPWRERHPLLAAPMVLWQLWRERRR